MILPSPLLIDALLLVVGALLLKRGCWPRRVGDMPHCSRCDYILSGDQRRCPECGAVADMKSVVRGDRHRSVVMAGIGGVLGLFALAILLLIVTRLLVVTVDWNRHKPLGWLLRDLGNTPGAWDEIQRRLANNLLSDSEQNVVVERGLQVQDVQSGNITNESILDYIGSRYLDHKLTSGQADRFFHTLLKAKLSVRPVVGAHSPLPFSITKIGRGPTTKWWTSLRAVESQLDDGPVQRNDIYTTSSSGGLRGLSTDGTVAMAGTPGKHRLRLKVDMTTGIIGGIPPGRVTQNLFADFETIEGDTPIATVVVPDASVLRPLLTPRLTVSPRFNPPVYFSVFATALPIDAAFDAFIRLDGKEYLMGGVYFHNGFSGSTYRYAGTEHVPADLPSNADVILRSSEAVARQTVDIKRMWKGEIVFKSLPIERPK